MSAALAPLQPLLSLFIIGLALALWVAASAATAWFWGTVIRHRDDWERSMQNHPSNRINRNTENKEN